MDRHELPTHLHVEDKLIAGLTVRQVLFLSVGLSVGYSLWLHVSSMAAHLSLVLAHRPRFAWLAPAPELCCLVLSALPVLVMVICILVRPAERPLEDWLLVALRYATLPKRAVWRPIAADVRSAVGPDDYPMDTDALSEWMRTAEDDPDDDDDATRVDARDSAGTVAGTGTEAAVLHRKPELALEDGAGRLSAGSQERAAVDARPIRDLPARRWNAAYRRQQTQTQTQTPAHVTVCLADSVQAGVAARQTVHVGAAHRNGGR